MNEEENFKSTTNEEDPNEVDLILSDDTDTLDEELSANGGLYPFDLSKADIDIREDPQTVYELVIRKYDQGKLILNPDFQRNRVWRPDQKSQFIETLILNFPVPPFYVNKDKNGNFIIVDGLQRISTMREFLTPPGFRLSGLKAVPSLNGKNFDDLQMLEGGLQSRIEDKKLTLYVINPSTPMAAVYDIFNRVNTGGTPLNRQEVRNCIFQGPATLFLKELAHSSEFLLAVDNGVSDNRMKAQEVVLRYLAFQIFDYNSYKGDMSEFLENAMREMNRKCTVKQFESEERPVFFFNLKTNFFRVMHRTHDFFDKANFRFPTEKNRGSINMAMFETVCYFFANQDDLYLFANKKKIVQNFQDLLSNPGYIKSSKYATGNRNSVLDRFKIVQEVLSKDTIL